MVVPAGNKHENLVDEILSFWKDFIGPDTIKKWGNSCQDLITMARSFCVDRKWEKAQECCEIASKVLRGGWDPRARKMETDYVSGAIEFYMATAFIGQGSIPIALEHYQHSSDIFSAKFDWMPVAVIWFTAGWIHNFNREWSESIHAYHRSLNALDTLPSRTSQVEKLAEKVRLELVKANKALYEDLRSPTPPAREPAINTSDKDLGVRKLYIVHKIPAGPARTTIDAIMDSSLSEENVIDTITVDTTHLKGAHIGLQVDGQSMVEAGILDGDYVFVRLEKNVENGMIVVASISPDGEEPENTLKKYYKEDAKSSQYPHHRLQPMNSSMPQMIIAPRGTDLKAIETMYRNRGISVAAKTGDVEIIGKLVAVWRKVEK